MGNLFFTLIVALIIYFLYGSLIFWSLGSALLVAFISLMFIDIKDEKRLKKC